MKAPDSIRRLAVLYPKAIGDFMFALPALHTLRRTWPDAFITLVVKGKQAPLAVPQQGVLADEVLVLGETGSGWDIRRALAARRPDVILDLAGNDQSGLLLAGQRGRRMRPHMRDCKGWCAAYSPMAESFPRLPAGLHRVEELLRFVAALGATEPVYSFRLRLPGEAIESSEQMTARYDLRSGTVVAVNLGASRATKRWPLAHVRTLARRLMETGFRVAFTGANRFDADGHYDRQAIGQLARDGLVDGEHGVDLVTFGDPGPTLQRQRDAYFLRYSGVPAVVVGCDTGPMQIAGSVGEDARNRTLSLFGPTNWGRYAPYDSSRRFPDRPSGDWNRVLRAPVSCAPAGVQEACARYRRGCRCVDCMRGLSPDTVYEAVVSVIGHDGIRPPGDAPLGTVKSFMKTVCEGVGM